MQYFDCTGVWGINGRKGYATFQYYVILQYSSIYFNIFLDFLVVQPSE